MTRSLILSGLIMLFTAGGYAAAEDAKKPAEEPLFKKAVGYYYQQKFEMAELMLQEELKTNPENALAYSYLGDIFLLKKRYDGAIDLYRKAVDLNPSSAEDHFRMGQIYYYKKDGKKAIEEFRKAYEINETIKYAYYHMGLSYLMLMRDKKQTIDSWETYLRIAPEDPQHEKIRRVIELLKDPNFIIPPVGSEISIEEALHLGGSVLKESEHKTEDKKAGHEKKKTKDTMEDVYRDDALK
jgi:tetratricopeptide (TPR) repeat protein